MGSTVVVAAMLASVMATETPAVPNVQPIVPLPPTTIVPLTPLPTAEPAEPERWYGAPAVVTDALALGLLTAGAFSRNEKLDAIGLTGLAASFVVAPIDHQRNGQEGHVGLSVGVRLAGVLATVAGFALLIKYGSCYPGDSDSQPLEGAREQKCIAQAVGVTAAAFAVPMALDDIFLARAPSGRPSASPPVSTGWR